MISDAGYAPRDLESGWCNWAKQWFYSSGCGIITNASRCFRVHKNRSAFLRLTSGSLFLRLGTQHWKSASCYPNNPRPLPSAMFLLMWTTRVLFPLMSRTLLYQLTGFQSHAVINLSSFTVNNHIVWNIKHTVMSSYVPWR